MRYVRGPALGFAIALFIMVQAASASEAPVAASIAGGALHIESSGDSLVWRIPPSACDQPVPASAVPTFRIRDGSGTGAGWHVTFVASDPFFGGPDPVAIPVERVRFQPGAGRVDVLDGQGGADAPLETVGGEVPLARDRGLRVLSADTGRGMGSYLYAPRASSFRLYVPPGTPPGTYTSTLTATINAAP